MPSLKDMRNQIGSVKATQKITKAMQMVAAAKLRKAQDAAENARPYAKRMAAVIANLAKGVSGDSAPAMLVGNGSQTNQLVVVATADRGLAGASTDVDGDPCAGETRPLADQWHPAGPGGEQVELAAGANDALARSGRIGRSAGQHQLGATARECARPVPRAEIGTGDIAELFELANVDVSRRSGGDRDGFLRRGRRRLACADARRIVVGALVVLTIVGAALQGEREQAGEAAGHRRFLRAR